MEKFVLWSAGSIFAGYLLMKAPTNIARLFVILISLSILNAISEMIDGEK